MADVPAAHVGREGTFTALGREWRYARWDRSVWVQLTKKAKEVLPDPQAQMIRHLEAMSLVDFKVYRQLLKEDQEERRQAAEDKREPVCVAGLFKPATDALAEKALDKASLYLEFQSAEMQSYVRSVEGATYIFWLLLKAHQPDVTEDQAFEIAEELGTRRVQEVFNTARGKEPVPNG